MVLCIFGLCEENQTYPLESMSPLHYPEIFKKEIQRMNFSLNYKSHLITFPSIKPILTFLPSFIPLPNRFLHLSRCYGTERLHLLNLILVFFLNLHNLSASSTRSRSAPAADAGISCAAGRTSTRINVQHRSSERGFLTLGKD